MTTEEVFEAILQYADELASVPNIQWPAITLAECLRTRVASWQRNHTEIMPFDWDDLESQDGSK